MGDMDHSCGSQASCKAALTGIRKASSKVRNVQAPADMACSARDSAHRAQTCATLHRSLQQRYPPRTPSTAPARTSRQQVMTRRSSIFQLLEHTPKMGGGVLLLTSHLTSVHFRGP